MMPVVSTATMTTLVPPPPKEKITTVPVPAYMCDNNNKRYGKLIPVTVIFTSNCWKIINKKPKGKKWIDL